MEDSLKEVFEELDKKPLPYVVPELKEESVLNLGEDFTFAVTYDTYPEVKIGEYKGIEVTEPKVKITAEDIASELDKIREKNSVVVEKKGDTVAKDDIVTVTYSELNDAGEEIPDSRREDFVFTVGTGYNIYKFDDEIVGMKKDKEKTFTKKFPADFEIESLRGAKKTLKVKVTTIKEKKLPDLDDELAQDVSEDYKTLDDMKKDIEKKLKEAAEGKLRNDTINAILEKIAEASEIDIPKAMIEAELESSWKNFAAQSRLPEEQILQLLAYENKSKESLFEEWRPAAEKSVKQQLVVIKLIETEKITAEDSDFEEEIKKQAELSKVSEEEVREYFEKNSMRSYIDSSIAEKKLFDFILSESKIKKGKEIKFLDLMAKKQ